MANAQHLAILKQGAKSWENYKYTYPRIQPDLRGADLKGFNLSGYNFVKNEFKEVDFSKAKLIGADFLGADIIHCNFSEADLSNATLSSATIVGGDFSRANLKGAHFHWTTLDRVKIDGGNFSDSIMGDTKFLGIDLSGMRGIEKIVHERPSSIDLNSILMSGINIPKSFYEGLGVPEVWASYFPTLLGAMEPIEFMSCFISYSNVDSEFIQKLYGGLKENKVPVWLDREDLKIGDRTQNTIDKAIRVRDKLMVILSKNSIASDWVEWEVSRALDEEEKRGEDSPPILFPIRIDNSIMETDTIWARRLKRTRNIGDFVGWEEDDEIYNKGFSRLLRDLKGE